MPHLHFMMDAYGVVEEHSNNLMAIYEQLNYVADKLSLEPVMPPFLVPYYYCNDAEDGGISAFIICRGGHITIHTFPYRSCYFVDVLSDNFFSASTAENVFRHQLYASRIQSSLIDRRVIYSMPSEEVDQHSDFGPHYMIEVNDCDMTMEWVFSWLDNVAEKINMLPISRPYVVYDSPSDPSYISGMLVVAQSHIAVHYNIHERKALIDIFSCEFLEGDTIEKILKKDFGDNTRWRLYSRGSKHNDQYKRKETRTAVSKAWRGNL